MSIDISLIPQERIKDLVSTLDTIQNNISTIDGNLKTTTSNLSTLQTNVTNNYTTLDNKIDSESSRIINIMDSSCVHKTGDETISGTKVLLNNLHIKNSNIEQLTAPGSYNERLLYAVDKNNVRIGSVGFAIDANGRSRTYIESSKVINGTATYGIIESYTDLNGNHSYYIGGNLVKGFVKETWQSGTSWYRIWSDGWIEQGGAWGTNTGAWAEASVTYLKAYKDTNYQLFVQGNWSSAECSSCKITSRSTAGFTGIYANNLYSVMPSWWYACGY